MGALTFNFTRWYNLLLTISLCSFATGEIVSNKSKSKQAITISKLEASRFLAQASMGGTTSEINKLATQIRAQGKLAACEAWIDEQFSLPRDAPLTERCAQVASGINYSGKRGANNQVGDYFHMAWWDHSIRANEQLRARMAFALSQIFVTSTNYWDGLFRGERYLGHVRYYDKLLNEAFSTHYNILETITYDPFMGLWLDLAQNGKGDPTKGIVPDENYAREVMQLFSCGIYKLDDSGENLLNSSGEPIENYTNEDIQTMARVFTGLSLTVPNNQGNPVLSRGGKNFLSLNVRSGRWVSTPMLPVEAHHDQGEKILLDGTLLPAGNKANVDIKTTLKVLAQHESTAPFMAHRLIQRLTSSNPSGDYIGRVVKAWRGNGQYGTGIEGDFKAILKAILLDPEVRENISYDKRLTENQKRYIITPTPKDELGGKVKEPLLKLTQLYRFLEISGATSTEVLQIPKSARAPGQRVLSASTVFNFYSAEYEPSIGPLAEAAQTEDYSLYAPEAQILPLHYSAELNRITDILKNGKSPAYNNLSPNIYIETNKLKKGSAHNLYRLLPNLNRYLCNGRLPLTVYNKLARNLDLTRNRGNLTWDESVAQLTAAIYGSSSYSVIY